MNEVFADTSFFVAVLSTRDSRHAEARQLAASISGRMVTTVWVLLELGNFVSRSPLRSKFAQFVDDLRQDRAALVLPPDEAELESGIQLYARRPDKDWSLVDSISFVVMEQRGIQQALTADHHFEQAGFEVLLK